MILSGRSSALIAAASSAIGKHNCWGATLPSPGLSPRCLEGKFECFHNTDLMDQKTLEEVSGQALLPRVLLRCAGTQHQPDAALPHRPEPCSPRSQQLPPGVALAMQPPNRSVWSKARVWRERRPFQEGTRRCPAGHRDAPGTSNPCSAPWNYRTRGAVAMWLFKLNLNLFLYSSSKWWSHFRRCFPNKF